MRLRGLVRNVICEVLSEEQNLNKKIIAYHGTPHGIFDRFSMKKRGTGADLTSVGDYGKGFYFSPNKEYALSYSTNTIGDKKNYNPTLYTVELKMSKPFDMRLLSKIQNRYNNLAKKYGVLNIPNEEYEKIYSELGINEQEEDFYREVENLIGDNWGDWNIKNKLKERGYDSLINYDGNEYVVYSPNQIKIVDVEKIDY